MPDENETPSTEELANELSETETSSPETAPETETTPPETPAEPTPEPTPSPSPEPESDPEPPAEREIAPPSSAQADKKSADSKRRKETIATAERPATEVDAEEEKRKAAIHEELAVVEAELQEHLDGIETCRAASRQLMAELYPHTVESDTLVDAVRGHIAAQKKIRANRQSNPARIAEILKAAGKAPIDAAFHRARARGMSRPTRTPPKSDTGDQGDGSKANAGSE